MEVPQNLSRQCHILNTITFCHWRSMLCLTLVNELWRVGLDSRIRSTVLATLVLFSWRRCGLFQILTGHPFKFFKVSSSPSMILGPVNSGNTEYRLPISDLLNLHLYFTSPPGGFFVLLSIRRVKFPHFSCLYWSVLNHVIWWLQLWIILSHEAPHIGSLCLSLLPFCCRFLFTCPVPVV